MLVVDRRRVGWARKVRGKGRLYDGMFFLFQLPEEEEVGRNFMLCLKGLSCTYRR